MTKTKLLSKIILTSFDVFLTLSIYSVSNTIRDLFFKKVSTEIYEPIKTLIAILETVRYSLEPHCIDMIPPDIATQI